MILRALAVLPLIHLSTPPVARVVNVVGMDYAFQVPAVIASGPTSFHFENRGKHSHEYNVALLRKGVAPRQYMDSLGAGRPVSALVERTVGVLFAEPGVASPSSLYTELLADRDYVVICIFRDDPNAPQHHQLGMFSVIRPRAVAAVAAAGVATTEPVALRVDTIVGRDYAYTLPATMTPGRHRFAFTNAGRQRHEISIERMKPGVTLAQVKALDDKGVDVGHLFDQSIGVLHSPGGTTPAGMLAVELVAGREYAVACTFQDNEKSPPHYKMGMTGSFKVGAARK